MAGDRLAAVTAFTASRPTATLLDLGLPPRPNDPEEGLAVLSGLLVLDRMAKVIVVSGQGDKQNALRAVGAGAYDFLCKPVDMDELRLVLKRCVYVAELEREYRAMQERARPEVFEEMLGASPQMQTVFAFIRKAATTSAPVLVLGENGTGKEMVARALHRRSSQRGGPFVPINCNAIPENLLETRALRPREGLVHGRPREPQGPGRNGRGGHDLPRRDRRAAGDAPGQAAAISPGEDLPARRRPPGAAQRRAGGGGHEHQPAGGGREREVPRGPLLPAGRARRHGPRPARAGRRRDARRPGVPAPLWRPARQAGPDVRARRRAGAEPPRLAGEHPRAPEPGAAGGDHGRGQARHGRRPGAGGCRGRAGGRRR